MVVVVVVVGVGVLTVVVVVVVVVTDGGRMRDATLAPGKKEKTAAASVIRPFHELCFCVVAFLRRHVKKGRGACAFSARSLASNWAAFLFGCWRVRCGRRPISGEHRVALRWLFCCCWWRSKLLGDRDLTPRLTALLYYNWHVSGAVIGSGQNLADRVRSGRIGSGRVE